MIAKLDHFNIISPPLLQFFFYLINILDYLLFIFFDYFISFIKVLIESRPWFWYSLFITSTISNSPPHNKVIKFLNGFSHIRYDTFPHYLFLVMGHFGFFEFFCVEMYQLL